MGGKNDQKPREGAIKPGSLLRRLITRSLSLQRQTAKLKRAPKYRGQPGKKANAKALVGSELKDKAEQAPTRRLNGGWRGRESCYAFTDVRQGQPRYPQRKRSRKETCKEGGNGRVIAFALMAKLNKHKGRIVKEGAHAGETPSRGGRESWVYVPTIIILP